MVITTKFFLWYFSGLWGLGGWILFFLISAAVLIFIYIDSHHRRLPALFWKLAATLLAVLLVPTIVYRFVAPEVQQTLEQFIEFIFYLGFMGGIVPFFVGLGYFLYYRGIRTCPNGHQYDASLSECPHCPPPEMVAKFEEKTKIEGLQDFNFNKQKAAAFLVTPHGISYQLNHGETSIGRQSSNDIVFADHKVSKTHAVIKESGKRFYLHDLASTNGTWLNGARIQESHLLERDDEIRLGNVVEVKFVQ